MTGFSCIKTIHDDLDCVGGELWLLLNLRAAQANPDVSNGVSPRAGGRV